MFRVVLATARTTLGSAFPWRFIFANVLQHKAQHVAGLSGGQLRPANVNAVERIPAGLACYGLELGKRYSVHCRNLTVSNSHNVVSGNVWLIVERRAQNFPR
jgi:hypothetical protein